LFGRGGLGEKRKINPGGKRVKSLTIKKGEHRKGKDRNLASQKEKGRGERQL